MIQDFAFISMFVLIILSLLLFFLTLSTKEFEGKLLLCNTVCTMSIMLLMSMSLYISTDILDIILIYSIVSASGVVVMEKFLWR